MTTTITDGTEVSTVLRTNLAPNPRPSGGLAGWAGSPGESVAYVVRAGAGAVELTDTAGGGGGYVYLDVPGVPGVGRAAAIGVDVEAANAQVAADMRVIVRTTDPAVVDTRIIATPVAAGGFARIAGALTQASTGGTATRFMIYPSATTTPGVQLWARRTVLAFADTEAQALAAVATFFDGSTPPAPPLSYAYLGAPGASPSVEVQTLPRASTPELVLSNVQEAEARTLAHVTLNGAAPDVTLRPVGTRAGAHRLFFLDRGDAQDAYLMHCQGRVFTLTDDVNPFNDMSYVVQGGRLTIEEIVEYGRWVVTVPYAEVTP